MAIKGYQFDRETPTPLSDALLYNALTRGHSRVIEDYGDAFECVATWSRDITIGTGFAIMAGRAVEVNTSEIMTVPSGFKGYVCISIDLSRVNQSTGSVGTPSYLPINNQLSFELKEEPVQEDISNGGELFDLPLWLIDGTGANVIVVERKDSFFSTLTGPVMPAVGQEFVTTSSTPPWELWGGGSEADWKLVGIDADILVSAGTNVTLNSSKANIIRDVVYVRVSGVVSSQAAGSRNVAKIPAEYTFGENVIAMACAPNTTAGIQYAFLSNVGDVRIDQNIAVQTFYASVSYVTTKPIVYNDTYKKYYWLRLK